MPAYKAVYSQTSYALIRALHPRIKAIIKNRIEEILENPYLGKALERDLAGYYSFRAKRYRIIYKIEDASRTIEIHYAGHRKDIYERFKELIGNMGG